MKSEVTVESLALYINRGITPKYTEVIDDSVIVLNQKCIRDFKVSLEPSRRNDLSKRKITEGKMLKKHDVLINSTGVGTLGRVAQYFGADDVATVDSHVTIVRPNPELVDPIYFGYLMKSKQSLIESFAEGTTGQTELNRNSVKELLLEIVNDIPTQKIIGGILLEIDQKLELNTQTNQTLEQIAQALFKSWFVDFDPVKAKIETLAAGGSAEDAELAAMRVISAKTVDELNSLKASNPEQFNKLAQTAALFPAAMQDSELGEIPEGWEVSSLSELIKITGGGTPKRSEETYWNGDIPWFSVKDVPSEGNVFVVDTDEKITELGLNKSSTKLLPKGTTIITARGTVGKLALVGTDMCMNQSCYGVLGKSVGDFYNYFNLKEAVSTLQRNTHGAVFDTITTQTFDTYSLAFSGVELANKFDALVAPLLQNIEANVRQNIELATLRDTLLPKLLSGELVGE
ncbi:restriction endonuclease subunit S [Vibrio vulnificus]|nr:restriction endonuclease subunit S [Vibrio vulnificus]